MERVSIRGGLELVFDPGKLFPEEVEGIVEFLRAIRDCRSGRGLPSDRLPQMESSEERPFVFDDATWARMDADERKDLMVSNSKLNAEAAKRNIEEIIGYTHSQ